MHDLPETALRHASTIGNSGVGRPTSVWVRGRFRATASCGIALVAALAASGCASPESKPNAVDEPIVAVLPFEVRGQDEGADYVGQALAESLAANLAQADNLQLLEVPTGSESVADERRESQYQAVDGATHIVTGTLTRDGAAVDLAIALHDSAKDEVLWVATLSADGGDLSGVVSGLAAQTVEALGSRHPDLYEYIAEVRGGPQMADSSLTALALEAERRNDIDGFLQASSDLVDRHPDEADAHVLHAWALMFAWDTDPSNETLLARLRERLDALDRVDPSSPYDDLVRAYVYRSSGQPEQARQLYARVLARNDLTVSARAWALRQRSFTHLQVGNAAAALADAEEAVELDPSNARSLTALSKALETLGRLDDAIAASQQALALEPASWRQHQRLGIVLSLAGKHGDGILAMERGCRLGENQEACANLAVTLQRGGRETEGLAAAELAKALPGSPWGFYNLACYQALAGNPAQALRDLDQALELGFADALIAADPDLDSLREDPALEKVVAAVEERLSSRQELSKSVFPWQA
jgi:tetratricopeptide (TPR) repeat protein